MCMDLSCECYVGVDRAGVTLCDGVFVMYLPKPVPLKYRCVASVVVIAVFLEGLTGIVTCWVTGRSVLRP